MKVLPKQARTDSSDGVELRVDGDRIHAVVSFPDTLVFRLADGDDRTQRFIVVDGLAGISTNDHIVAVGGRDIDQSALSEALEQLQNAQTDPSTWPLELAFERMNGSSTSDKSVDTNTVEQRATEHTHISRAVDATELQPTGVHPIRQANTPTIQRDVVMAPQQAAFVPQLVVLPIQLKLIAALGVSLAVAGLCAYVSLYDLPVRVFDAKQSTDKTIAAFIDGWTTLLGVAIAAADALVQYISLGGLVAVFATLQSLRTGQDWRVNLLQSKTVLSIVVVSSVSSALSGLSIQRKPSRILSAMTEFDFQKFVSDDYNMRTDSHMFKYETQAYAPTRSGDSILRQSMYPLITTNSYCSNTDVTMTPVSVAYRFYHNDWQKQMLPTGLQPLETYVVPGFEGLPNVPLQRANDATPSYLMLGPMANKTSFTLDEAYELEELFIRSMYLYADAVALEATQSGDATVAMAMRTARDDSITYLLANDVRSAATGASDLKMHIRAFVDKYFAAVTQWSTVLQVTPSEIKVEYATFKLSSTINFTSVTVTVPQRRGLWYRVLTERNGDLVDLNATWSPSDKLMYEIPVTRECSTKTCGVQNRGYAPDPHVTLYGDCVDGYDCASAVTRLSHLVFGFGRRIEGDAFELLELPSGKSASVRKAVVRNPRDSHMMTMGRLRVQTEDLAAKFQAECKNAYGCSGVQFELTTPEDSTSPKQFLVLHNSLIPSNRPGFSLVNNSARGKRLVSRTTQAGRVGYELLHPYNFGLFNYSFQFRENCSSAMEVYAIDATVNFVYQEHPLQVTYTAAMFHLFQNARLTSQLPEDKGESLAFLGNQELIDVVISLPATLFGLACLSCAVVIVLLSITLSTANVVDLRLLRQPKTALQAFISTSDFPRSLLALLVYTRPDTPPLRLDELQVNHVEFGHAAHASVTFRAESSRLMPRKPQQ